MAVGSSCSVPGRQSEYLGSPAGCLWCWVGLDYHGRNSRAPHLRIGRIDRSLQSPQSDRLDLRDHYHYRTHCCGLRQIMAMGWRPAVPLQEKGIAMSEHTPAPNKTVPAEVAAGPAAEAAVVGPQAGPHTPHTHSPGSSEHESGPDTKAQEPKTQISSADSSAPEIKPTERPHVVVFKNVCKTFGNGSDAKVALHDISFTVEDLPNIGELVTIVGPSGCGKSTLLRIIAGLKPHFPPSTGEVHVFGKPVEEPGPDRGLVDQKYSLLPHLTVLENVAFGLKLRGVSRSKRLDQAHEWVTKVGLDGCERKYPSELSGGM